MYAAIAVGVHHALSSISTRLRHHHLTTSFSPPPLPPRPYHLHPLPVGDDLELEVRSERHPVVAVKGARIGDFNGKTLSTISSTQVRAGCMLGNDGPCQA